MKQPQAYIIHSALSLSLFECHTQHDKKKDEFPSPASCAYLTGTDSLQSTLSRKIRQTLVVTVVRTKTHQLLVKLYKQPKQYIRQMSALVLH